LQAAFGKSQKKGLGKSPKEGGDRRARGTDKMDASVGILGPFGLADAKPGLGKFEEAIIGRKEGFCT